MHPLYFGDSRYRLFGIYKASVDPVSRRGVILCHSWGREYVNSHRSIKHLADQLAKTGFHTLRFDYYGTGDSYGDSEEVRLNKWVDNAKSAIEELKDTADIRDISVIGLRLGSIVATRALHPQFDVQRIVLWDPVFDGRTYLHELMGADGCANGLDKEKTMEITGFPLPWRMYEDILGIDDGAYISELPKALLVSTLDEQGYFDGLKRRLGDVGTRFEYHEYLGMAPWYQEGEFGGTGLPVQAIQGIVKWLK